MTELIQEIFALYGERSGWFLGLLWDHFLLSGQAILLMDEPFGAVDEITRRQLQDEILRIHQERGITILFVTHDIEEALKLGTRVLVMEEGQAAQFDPPSNLMGRPATPFVSQLVRRSREFAPRA